MGSIVYKCFGLKYYKWTSLKGLGRRQSFSIRALHASFSFCVFLSFFTLIFGTIGFVSRLLMHAMKGSKMVQSYGVTVILAVSCTHIFLPAANVDLPKKPKCTRTRTCTVHPQQDTHLRWGGERALHPRLTSSYVHKFTFLILRSSNKLTKHSKQPDTISLYLSHKFTWIKEINRHNWFFKFGGMLCNIFNILLHL